MKITSFISDKEKFRKYCDENNITVSFQCIDDLDGNKTYEIYCADDDAENLKKIHNYLTSIQLKSDNVETYAQLPDVVPNIIATFRALYLNDIVENDFFSEKVLKLTEEVIEQSKNTYQKAKEEFNQDADDIEFYLDMPNETGFEGIELNSIFEDYLIINDIQTITYKTYLNFCDDFGLNPESTITSPDGYAANVYQWFYEVLSDQYADNFGVESFKYIKFFDETYTIVISGVLTNKHHANQFLQLIQNTKV